MAKLPTISFSKNTLPAAGTLVVLMPAKASLPETVEQSAAADQINRAIKVEKFTGKALASIGLVAPEGGLDKIVLLGCGDLEEASESSLLKIGGKIMASAGKAEKIFVMTDNEAFTADQIAMVASGAKLRSYRFDDYLTKGREADKKPKKQARITFGTNSLAATRKAWARADGVSDGVNLARQLVNEPANILGPVEFAKAAQKLKTLGVEVEVVVLVGPAGRDRAREVEVAEWTLGRYIATPVVGRKDVHLDVALEVEGGFGGGIRARQHGDHNEDQDP